LGAADQTFRQGTQGGLEFDLQRQTQRGLGERSGGNANRGKENEEIEEEAFWGVLPEEPWGFRKARRYEGVIGKRVS